MGPLAVPLPAQFSPLVEEDSMLLVDFSEKGKKSHILKVIYSSSGIKC